MSRAPDELARRLGRWEIAFTLLAFLGGALALAVAFETPRLMVVGVVAAAVYPVSRRMRLRAGTPLEAALTLLALLLAYPLQLFSREPAQGLAMFLLVMQAAKMIAPRNAERDRGLARLVGVVLAGVAAAEGVELYFGVALAACLLLHLLAGTLATLSAQVEQALASGPTDGELSAVGGHPGRTRVAGAHLLSLAVVVASSTVTFLLIPRMGAKLLPRRSASTQRLSGFSDLVGLEDIGRLKQNDRVALRVELADGSQRLQDPYWRGAVLDTYDGSVWLARDLRSFGLRLTPLDSLGVRDPLLELPAGAERSEATFYMQPIGSNYLFTLGATQEVHFRNTRPRRLRRTLHGAYGIGNAYTITLAYRTTWYPTDVPRLRLNPTLVRHVRRTCLELPQRVDRERLQRYGDDVLRKLKLDPARTPPAQIADVLDRHLRTTFRYSTRSTRDPSREPVEEFLTTKKEGHCEFFASALALLLRCQGIPARLITGFRGGEFNPWTGTYTIRQREAHAWVEALIDGRWRRYDPTPADPAASGQNTFLSTASAFQDWIELKWFQYVIAFDAYDQQNALFLLREEWAPYAEHLGELLARPGPRLAARLGALLLGLGLLAAALWGLRRLSWRGGLVVGVGGDPGAARGQALRRLLVALGRHHLVRRPGETPLELARRAQRSLGPHAAGLAEWIPRYYADRYGGRPLTPAELSRLEQLLASLEQPLAVQPGVGGSPARP